MMHRKWITKEEAKEFWPVGKSLSPLSVPPAYLDELYEEIMPKTDPTRIIDVPPFKRPNQV